MRHVAITCRLLLIAALLLAGALLTPGFAAAAQGESSAAPDALSDSARQKLLDTRAELENLHRQLAEISTAVLKENPALQEQEEKLRDLMLNTMKDAGYEPEKDVEHIKELTSKLRSESIDTEKKKQLLTDYRQTQERLIAAQRAALGNKEVQQAQQNYKDQMRQAMEKENPDSKALIQRYQKTQIELQQQVEEAVKSRGGNN